jgi:hypothetical protein
MQGIEDRLTEAFEGSHEDWCEEGMGDPSSWAMTLTGGALLAVGLKRRKLMGTAMAALGGYLLYRGLTSGAEIEIEFEEEISETAFPEARGKSMQPPAYSPEGHAPESGEHREAAEGSRAHFQAGPQGESSGLAPESGDRVIEGSEESFPASDAPSWTPGRA